MQPKWPVLPQVTLHKAFASVAVCKLITQVGKLQGPTVLMAIEQLIGSYASGAGNTYGN